MAFLQRFRIQEITSGVGEAAFAIPEQYGLSCRDRAIIAAAQAGECDTVCSEDPNAGQDYGGVRVLNPFA